MKICLLRESVQYNSFLNIALFYVASVRFTAQLLVTVGTIKVHRNLANVNSHSLCLSNTLAVPLTVFVLRKVNCIGCVGFGVNLSESYLPLLL